MHRLQLFAFAYAALLGGLTALALLPGVRDTNGLTLGFLQRDIYDDAVFAVAAVWALCAGLTSANASRIFAVIFGGAMLLDGLMALATGYGFLDLGVFTHTSVGVSVSPDRLLPTLPMLLLGGVAFFGGLLAEGVDRTDLGCAARAPNPPRLLAARSSKGGMIRLLAWAPLAALCWMMLLVTVARFSDTAPAYVVPYPTREFVRALPEDARVANYRPHAITVTSDDPGFAARLYAAGAVLVLPAGLPGCAPFSRTRSS